MQSFSQNNGAIAALKADGSVFAFGQQDFGGNSSKVQKQLVDVQHIYSTKRAFAALKAGGSVVTWGFKDEGGDSSKVQSQLAADVQHIYATETAFAALKADGSVVSWGSNRQQVEALARHQ